MPFTEVKSYLTDEDLEVMDNTDDILMAAISWILHEQETRKENVHDLFMSIGLDICSLYCLRMVTKKYEDLISYGRVMKVNFDLTLDRVVPVQT